MKTHKNLILKETSDVFDYQNLEKEIFYLEHFNPYETAFPKRIFKAKFEAFYLIQIKDWFSDPNDYQMLTNFLKKMNSAYFYASAPAFYMVNALKVSFSDLFEEYSQNHAYEGENGELQGVGLRKSPETFYYDDSKKWAMVCDITNNITIAGVTKDSVENFEKSFTGFEKISFNNGLFNTAGSKFNF